MSNIIPKIIAVPPDQATPLHGGEHIEVEVDRDREDGVPLSSQFRPSIRHIDFAGCARPSTEE